MIDFLKACYLEVGSILENSDECLPRILHAKEICIQAINGTSILDGLEEDLHICCSISGTGFRGISTLQSGDTHLV